MVYLHTNALKILFDPANPGKVSAVSVSTQGLEYTISAKKEIVLSAGVFHSPQLLMVSGENLCPPSPISINDIELVVI